MSAHSLFIYGNIAKGITDPRVEFISQVLTQIFKFHLQNLDQASTSKSQPNISILINLYQTSIRISTKAQLHNRNQTSEGKYWPNFSFKISPELPLQNLDQILYLKSDQKFSFMTKLQLPNLHQIVVNMFLGININNNNNLNMFWVGIFTHQGHINQVYHTAVSYSVTDKGSQWLDSGLIICFVSRLAWNY